MLDCALLAAYSNTGMPTEAPQVLLGTWTGYLHRPPMSPLTYDGFLYILQCHIAVNIDRHVSLGCTIKCSGFN